MGVRVQIPPTAPYLKISEPLCIKGFFFYRLLHLILQGVKRDQFQPSGQELVKNIFFTNLNEKWTDPLSEGAVHFLLFLWILHFPI